MTNSEKTQQHAVIYEVNLTVPKNRQQELLGWLTPHIDEMLALPGFTGAHTLQHDSEDQASDLFNCTVHYYLDSEQSMQRYFEEFAEPMRASGVQLFKQDLQTTRRVLKSHAMMNIATPHLPATTINAAEESQAGATCMDCASSLQGNFCHTCGQRKQRRLISVFSLIAEFFEGLIDWDSRFWRTIKPLLFKPGLLTEAYLNGQRERYTPPIRMYLITSVIFFLLVAVAPQSAFKGEGDLTLEDFQTQVEDEEDSSASTDTTDLQVHVTIDDAAPDTPTTATTSQNSQEDSDEKTEKRTMHEVCEESFGPENSDIETESIREPLYRICHGLATRSGVRAFIREFFDNLPKTLFVLLPLMALINKLFYPFSKRYYVEHLLYYVHNYSFLFLFGTMLLLASAALKWFGVEWPEWISVAATIYVMYYFLKSMRVVYRQSRWATALKWSGLMAVFIFLSTVLVIGLAVGSAVLTT